jgi:hypothetical protein
MILKDDNQFEPGVFPQGQVSFPIGQENFFYLFILHEGNTLVMLGGFDDDLVLAHTVHFAEKAGFFTAGQASLRDEGGKFIGYNPYPPSRAVGGASLAIGQGFGRGQLFVAGAERAIRPVIGLRLRCS